MRTHRDAIAATLILTIGAVGAALVLATDLYVQAPPLEARGASTLIQTVTPGHSDLHGAVPTRLAANEVCS